MIQRLLVFLILMTSSLLSAQSSDHEQCGYLAPPSEVARILQNKTLAQQNSFPEGNTYYVPIQYHLVGTDNGDGYISEEDALDGICKLNQDFAETDLQFYFSGYFNYINSSLTYDLTFPDVPAAVTQVYASNKVPNAINIFIGNGLSSGNSGYYTPSQDIIYMGKTYVSINTNILAHEVGHFFSLMHPFYGWENTPYDPTQPTPTVVNYFGPHNVEYVDRSINCENSGDFLCGTPADYILDWNGGCNYTGGAVDPDSVLLDPDEANFMGYYSFAGCAEYHFSDDQIDVMMADYFNRPALANLAPPNIQAVQDSAVLIAPDNTFEEVYTHVEFEWEEVLNATNYFIEISRFEAFIYSDEWAIVDSPNYTATSLFKNKDYYWRISAFNNTDVCAEKKYSVTNTFSTGDLQTTSTTNLKNQSAIKISPNPIHQNSNDVNVLLEKPFHNLEINLFDIKGQLILGKQIDKLDAGFTSILNENEMNFAKGMYFLQIKNSEINSIQKLIIN